MGRISFEDNDHQKKMQVLSAVLGKVRSGGELSTEADDVAPALPLDAAATEAEKEEYEKSLF